MAEHHLKTWPNAFDAVKRGDKLFEYRKDDRGFEVGDVLVLERWDPVHGYYVTERDGKKMVPVRERLRVVVAYILRGIHGVPPGYCVMGIREEAPARSGNADERRYPDLDPMELEPEYSAHVAALTAEGLHSKAAIAEQLAYRDRMIGALRAEVQRLLREVNGKPNIAPQEWAVIPDEPVDQDPVWIAIKDRYVVSQSERVVPAFRSGDKYQHRDIPWMFFEREHLLAWRKRAPGDAIPGYPNQLIEELEK